MAVSIVALLWLPAAAAAGAIWRKPVAAVLACAVIAAAVLRWRFPVVAACSAFLATAIAVLLGVTRDPFLVAGWALYPLALARGSRSGCFPPATLFLLGVVAAIAGTPGDPSTWDYARFGLTSAAALIGSWIIGGAIGRQVAAVREASRAEARRAVSEGQLRVAREVHDVVAHTLGTIGIEAGVARHVQSLPPEEFRKILLDIEQSARSALVQVQGLLRTLRPNDVATSDPAPAATDLNDLIVRAKQLGIRTTLAMSGVDRLGDAEQMTTYRIVQEAVTNVVKHAPGAACDVKICAAHDSVVVTVTDDGPGRPVGTRDGHGLIGLRERVALAGGSSVIGNKRGGGFQVRAEIPVSLERDE